MTLLKKHYPAFIMIVIILIAWEGLVRVTNIPLYILPAPTQIADALLRDKDIIFAHTLVTLFEAILGFVIAIIVSLILGVIIDNFSFFKRGFYPILVASQTIPIIAIAPLFFIWFGFGILPKVIIVALVAFFPIVVNLVDGLNSADNSLIAMLQTMNATKWQIFTKVRFPSALPSLFSGMRIAATYSVMGAVIGEWLGASKGLGLYMKNTLHSFLTDQVFAAIIVVVATSILFYGSLLLLEARVISWNKKTQEDK